MKPLLGLAVATATLTACFGPKKECDEGRTQCDGDVLQQCESGFWTDWEECGTCRVSSGEAECEDLGPPPTAPVVSNLRFSIDGWELVVQFDVQDANGDLDGGVLELEVNEYRETIPLPTAEFEWNPSGTSTLRMPFTPCDVGGAAYVSIVIRDAGGLASTKVGSTTNFDGLRVVESENNDYLDYADPVDFYRGMGLCGNISKALVSSGQYAGDADVFELNVKTGGSGIKMLLEWEKPNTHYHLWLLTPDGDTIATDQPTGTRHSAALQQPLTTGQTYYLVVAGADGQAGAYWVTFE